MERFIDAAKGVGKGSVSKIENMLVIAQS